MGVAAAVMGAVAAVMGAVVVVTEAVAGAWEAATGGAWEVVEEVGETAHSERNPHLRGAASSRQQRHIRHLTLPHRRP